MCAILPRMAKFAFREDPPERVTGVALREKLTGRVHSGGGAAIHSDLYHHVGTEDPQGNITIHTPFEPGFTTSKRGFVSREEALGVANNAKQSYSKTGRSGSLYSEMVKR